ncbi:MAG: carboxylate--amine ligase [Candidatus Omnitrophica bacterium]|nr:carboxylate--amine ligase [Candidatus Omnitrophota bacterium]
MGLDCNKYYLQRAETQEKHLIPTADKPYYIDFLKEMIQETKPDLLYMQPDQEIAVVSRYRQELNAKVFLPDDETIQLCQDKFVSFQRWKQAGIKVPENIVINNPDDLKEAFSSFGTPLWIRAIISPGGGKGSFKAPDFDIAKAWIDYCKGWGNFVAAQCLREDSITWQSIWKDGELIVAQGRKRLYWEFGNRAPSGVTGLTGAGVTVSDPVVDDIAQKCVLAIDTKPNGIFSVDLTYDFDGVPNPTEINIGRFFTTHLFFTRAGLNMPYIFVKLALGQECPVPAKKKNVLPSDLVWIRGMDFHPVLTDVKNIQACEDIFNRRRDRLKEKK